MFSVEDYNESITAKTLQHSANVFHEALADGERYYHVKNDKGPDYDLLYKGNMEWFGDLLPTFAGDIVPEFLSYDEHDGDSIDIDLLNAYTQWICLKADEYSIALARAVLTFTKREVFAMDPRILWFLEPQERLHVGVMPQETDTTVYLVGPIGNGFITGEKDTANENKKSDIFTFNSAFYMQDMLHGRMRSEVKYLELPFENNIMGIGGILINAARFERFAEQLGLQIVYNKEVMGKFKVSSLKKYFRMDYAHADSTPENTLSVREITFLHDTWRYYCISGCIDADMLQDKFREDLEEYADAVMGGKKALGVLIRGTDYIATGLDRSRRQATAEEMVPVIRSWIEEDGYERIVLATEDADILKKMQDTFGKQVIAIAQERHSTTEFKKGQVINEFEKELYTEDEYDNRVIETTINYFYALYLLARCDSFMSSGQNNGWDTVNALNGGKFLRSKRFMNGKLE